MTEKQKKTRKMNDLDCRVIEVMAVSHLMRCAFSDWTIAATESAKSFKELKKRI